MLKRMVPALYVADIESSKQFYCGLFAFAVSFEADWIVQLSSPAKETIELILQPRDGELIPEAFRKSPQGSSLTFVVEDCDALYRKALGMELEIIQEPANEEYGQRRFLTIDPDGLLIDVSSECEPSPAFMEKYFK